MMLPAFDEHGNLPPGCHRASEADVIERFGSGSARRKWLAQRLREILQLGRRTGFIERVFLWGSFVTGKESPNDLDLLLVAGDTFNLERLDAETRVLFDYVQARLRFSAIYSGPALPSARIYSTSGWKRTSWDAISGDGASWR